MEKYFIKNDFTENNELMKDPQYKNLFFILNLNGKNKIKTVSSLIDKQYLNYDIDPNLQSLEII